MRKKCYYCAAVLPDNSSVCLLCGYDNAGIKTMAEEEAARAAEEEEMDRNSLPGDTYKKCYNCGSLWIGTSLICPICGYNHQTDSQDDPDTSDGNASGESNEGEYFKICSFCNGRNNVEAKYCALCENTLEHSKIARVKSDEQIRRAREKESADRESKILDEMRREQESRKLDRLKLKFLSHKKMEDPKFCMVTTGSSFEGYEVLDYVTIVSGETLVPERLLDGINSGKYNNLTAINKAKIVATESMKKTALKLGANGVLGVGISHQEMKGGILVSACGTAVRIIPETEEF